MPASSFTAFTANRELRPHRVYCGIICATVGYCALNCSGDVRWEVGVVEAGGHGCPHQRPLAARSQAGALPHSSANHHLRPVPAGKVGAERDRLRASIAQQLQA